MKQISQYVGSEVRRLEETGANGSMGVLVNTPQR